MSNTEIGMSRGFSDMIRQTENRNGRAGCRSLTKSWLKSTWNSRDF